MGISFPLKSARLMTKQKESSDQGIRKTEQDSAQPIKQKIRWIPNNSGPRKKKGNAIEFGGRVVSWQKYLKTMDPAVPAPKTVKFWIPHQSFTHLHFFHCFEGKLLFDFKIKKKTIKGTNYNFFTKGSELIAKEELRFHRKRTVQGNGKSYWKIEKYSIRIWGNRTIGVEFVPEDGSSNNSSLEFWIPPRVFSSISTSCSSAHPLFRMKTIKDTNL